MTYKVLSQISLDDLPEVKYKNISEDKIAYRKLTTSEENRDQDDIPLFLLPPWPSSSITLYPLASILDLGADLILLDTPGFSGESKLSWQVNNNFFDRILTVFADFINSFDYKSYNILGYSYGGLILQALISKDMVNPKKVIFVSSLNNHARFIQKQKKRFQILKSLANLKLFRKVILKYARSYLRRKWKRAEVDFDEVLKYELVAKVLKDIYDSSLVNLMNTISSIPQEDFPLNFKNKTYAKNIYTDLENHKMYGSHLNQYINDVTIYKKVGHPHMFFAPEIYVNDIKKFIRKR
jgi:pimeloyl-ACP methyl ester carboxylesterase